MPHTEALVAGIREDTKKTATGACGHGGRLGGGRGRDLINELIRREHALLSLKWNSRGNRKYDGHPLFRSGRCLPFRSPSMVTIQAFLVWLFDQRTRLFDTPRHQVRFNFGLLAGEQ